MRKYVSIILTGRKILIQKCSNALKNIFNTFQKAHLNFISYIDLWFF